MNIFGKVFNSLGHFAAWLLHSAIPVAETAAKDVSAVAASPLGTMIADAAGAQGIAIQAGIEAVAGTVVASLDSLDTTLGDLVTQVQTKGVNVVFDAKGAADVVALYNLLKGQTVGAAVTAAKAPLTLPAPAA